MLKTLGLITAIIAAVALTIAVCLGGIALLGIALLALWGSVRHFFPSRNTAAAGVSQNLLRTTADLRRFQQAHSETVLGLVVLPNNSWMVSTSGDQTLRVWDGEGNEETVYRLPIYPGPLAVGDHEENGLRVALGIFEQESREKNAPIVLVWEPIAAPPTDAPQFTLSFPNVRLVHAVAWDDDANFLRVLAGVYDTTHPNLDTESDTPNRLVLLQFDLRVLDGSGLTPPPLLLPVPPEWKNLPPWQVENRKNFALSANGLYLACQTEYTDGQNEGGFGVGVWDIDAGAWRRRFGGREAQPHDVWAVSKNGDRVYSSRHDEPRRDYRNGGPEWYDGLYVWDALSSPPEDKKEAAPISGLSGSQNMVFSSDETLMANPTGATGTVEIFDMQTKTRLQRFQRPEPPKSEKPYGHSVWCCAFCDNDRELITGHADGQLWWWGVASPPSENG